MVQVKRWEGTPSPDIFSLTFFIPLHFNQKNFILSKIYVIDKLGTPLINNEKCIISF